MRMEDKASIANPGGSAPQRGWSAVGAENSSTLYRKGLLKSRMTEDLKDARVGIDDLQIFQQLAYKIRSILTKARRVISNFQRDGQMRIYYQASGRRWRRLLR